MKNRDESQGMKVSSFSKIQLYTLVVLRVAIGWHFLYEGISKLFTPNWTSATYLELSRWIFSDFFHWLAADPTLLRMVDFMNIWGLILIGFALIAGLFTRGVGIAGIVFLLLYYLANPPFIGLDFGVVKEGNYLVVDKNLIELFALAIVVLFPTSSVFGLDRLVLRLREIMSRSKNEKPETEMKEAFQSISNRRDILKALATFPFIAAFAWAVFKKKKWESFEENNLVDAVTSATIKTYNFSTLNDLKGQVPSAEICGKKFSRVILGGNLIGGWAHARDLIYVSKLVKAYHNRDKVFETLLMAEKCGINAFLTNPLLCKTINEYWRHNVGKIQFISDCGGEDLIERVQTSIDNGAAACYVQGAKADKLVQQGKIDLIAKALDLIRKNGLPAGIGGHPLETIKACVEYGLEPDFWMKTLHHTNYWSAKADTEHDNIWDPNPQETIDFMKNLKKPWIAFKILAAGAIHPQVGFRYAFENGADFICVGMRFYRTI
jgi:uncharacterized membrane protein YphA (DoxX/SURF4 family)